MVVGEKTLNTSLRFRFDGASYTSTLVSSFRLPRYAAIHWWILPGPESRAGKVCDPNPTLSVSVETSSRPVITRGIRLRLAHASLCGLRRLGDRNFLPSFPSQDGGDKPAPIICSCLPDQDQLRRENSEVNHADPHRVGRPLHSRSNPLLALALSENNHSIPQRVVWCWESSTT